MSEQELQSKCIKYAKSQGWYVLKVIKCNVSGFPDSVLFKDGQTIFVEYKAINGTQSELQKYQQIQLENQGFKYFLVNNLNYFKEILVY